MKRRPKFYVTGDGRMVDIRATNQLLIAYGSGPRGARCETCSRLFVHEPGSRRYYKCSLRALTFGPGSDHRISWPACAKYEERKES